MKGMSQDFTIHTATKKELSYMLALAEKEGWSPGNYDEEAFYAQDPDGFFIGRVGDRPIGCISNVCYDNHFAFLGLYIVEKAFRGKGYGLKLWNHAIEYAKDRSIGLDGVIAQQPNYIKSGFTLAYRNIRYACEKIEGRNASLTAVNTLPFEALLSYDAEIFGIERAAFLKQWISLPDRIALAKVDQSKIQGYGVIRSCKNCYKVGPLFAENLSIAYEIYVALQHYAKEKPIFLDVPECNPLALELAKELHGKQVFETARMYTKSAPRQRLQETFGITTFELG